MGNNMLLHTRELYIYAMEERVKAATDPVGLGT